MLEAIARTGSISAAGREFGMAYRSWLLVDSLNHMFAGPLVQTREGGRIGGGADLTELGGKVVALYREAEAKVRALAAVEIAGIEQVLAE